ncbi:D-galacturonate reductase-like [Pyrus ussuriensis x Pyrus communis]|uniref:D-galacturonate reductase-like n=1 Tax=Pyrus ussuriensis x Pyrus communis TaxID=2448454 RepID=A0A5N5HLF4_9ROSA|nr:D-galacturonate reductase-like [Pyrus ussuriensis x Pyrus communis]
MITSLRLDLRNPERVPYGLAFRVIYPLGAHKEEGEEAEIGGGGNWWRWGWIGGWPLPSLEIKARSGDFAPLVPSEVSNSVWFSGFWCSATESSAAAFPEVTLSSCDTTMPVIGMGTSSYPKVDPETAKAAILEAIRAGYRHFDTAFAYGSEQDLGEAIAEALRLGLVKSRSELFITTKLFASFAERELVVPAINKICGYVPNTWPFKFGKVVSSMPVEKGVLLPLDIKSVWEGMEECKRLGLARGIGVSNFTSEMLEDLLSIAKIPPALNQLEMNPLWQLKKLREFCKAKGIHVTAYSPLGSSGTKFGGNKILGSKVLQDIAESKGKTTAQIALRWVYQQGVSLVTKSVNKERMNQNIDIFGWSLTEEELDEIGRLPQHKTITFASIMGPHDVVLQIDAGL